MARGRPKGSKNKSPSREGDNSRVSAAKIAELTGASRATVERVRAVLASGEDDIIARLMAGELPAYTAYKQVQQRHWERQMAQEGSE